jgi:hypothetical protein
LSALTRRNQASLHQELIDTHFHLQQLYVDERRTAHSPHGAALATEFCFDFDGRWWVILHPAPVRCNSFGANFFKSGMRHDFFELRENRAP